MATNGGLATCWPGARRSEARPNWRMESAAQGRAFLEGVRAAWPQPRLDSLLRLACDTDRTLAYPVAVGVACSAVGIDEASARLAYLQAFAANLVSAGIRLIPLGQSDGLRVLAALEETVRAVAAESAELGLADLGTCYVDGRLDIGSPRDAVHAVVPLMMAMGSGQPHCSPALAPPSTGESRPDGVRFASYEIAERSSLRGGLCPTKQSRPPRGLLRSARNDAPAKPGRDSIGARA